MSNGILGMCFSNTTFWIKRRGHILGFTFSTNRGYIYYMCPLRVEVWLPFPLISFFSPNFLSSVLFSFLELIMFCRWLHAKGLLNQSLFSVYLKSLTSHSQLLNATKGPLTDKTIYYTSIRVTELIWKVKFCFHFYISAYRLQSDMIWR